MLTQGHIQRVPRSCSRSLCSESIERQFILLDCIRPACPAVEEMIVHPGIQRCQLPVQGQLILDNTGEQNREAARLIGQEVAFAQGRPKSFSQCLFRHVPGSGCALLLKAA